MTVRVIAGIHFDAGDVSHWWFAGDDACPAYGALKFRDAGTVFFDGTPALVNKVIAELVALRAEMTGDDTAAGSGAPGWCPAATVYDEGGDHFPLYCDRERGHNGSHHAPGPDKDSEVAWSDEAAVAP